MVCGEVPFYHSFNQVVTVAEVFTHVIHNCKGWNTAKVYMYFQTLHIKAGETHTHTSLPPITYRYNPQKEIITL